MKEIVDLVKKVLELLPASLKAGKGALGLVGTALGLLTKLLPKKAKAEEAKAEEPKAEKPKAEKPKAKGKSAKLGLVLSALFLLGTCAFKSLQALKKAKQ